MDQIILVCGNWKFDQTHWVFLVDTSFGCKIIQVSEDVRYDEFVRMVHEDFDINQQVYKIKLSYVCNELMRSLPQDTPPIFVTNERQLRGFVLQFQKEAIRLCVEVSRRSQLSVKEGCRFEPKCEPSYDTTCGRQSSTYGRFTHTAQKEEEHVEYAEEEDTEGDIRFDYCEDLDGASSGDEDFIGVQSKCKEEELPLKKSSSTFDDEYLDIEMRSLQLAVGQIYPTKADLESRLKIYSVLHRFDFDVVSSTKMLLVVKCWVQNCAWRVRASRHDVQNPCFYIRKYCGEHSCSVTERSSRGRQATADILGRLYVDYVGGVGPSVLPRHVADLLNKRFGLKVQFLSRRP